MKSKFLIFILINFLFLNIRLAVLAQETANLNGNLPQEGTAAEMSSSGPKPEQPPEASGDDSVAAGEVVNTPESSSKSALSMDSQKSAEYDRQNYDEKIKRMELLNIIVIALFILSLFLNGYIFLKTRNGPR